MNMPSRARGLLALLLFQSFFWSSHIPFVPKLALTALALAVFALGSAWRPRDGLLVVAALLPLGAVLADPVEVGVRTSEALANARVDVWNMHRDELTEIIRDASAVSPEGLGDILVLTFLGGCALGGAWRLGIHRPAPGPLAVPALLFCAAMLGSCVVTLGAWHTANAASAPESGRQLLDIIARGYAGLRQAPSSSPVDAFRSVHAAVTAVAGAALVLVTYSLCRNDPRFVERAVKMIVVGVAGAGALSLVAMAFYILHHDDPLTLQVALRQRWTMFASLNTGAPLLVMAAPLAAASAGLPRANRAVWWTVTALLIGALGLNATRAAILSSVLVAAGVLLVIFFRPGRGLKAAAVMLVAAVGLAGSTFLRYQTASGYLDSTVSRLELWAQAVDLVQERPIVGHGIGQYRQAAYPRHGHGKPPHSHYLRLAAETGVTGAGSFLWLVAAALWLMLRGLRARPGDCLLLAVCAGVTAYLLGNLARSSLNTMVTAVPFWILLGLGAARGADACRLPLAESAAGTAARAGTGWRRWWAWTPLNAARRTPARISRVHRQRGGDA